MKLDSDKYGSLNNSLREAAPYLGLGLQLAVTIVIMVLIGDWLDSKFGYRYLFTIIFAVLGIGAGIYNLIRTINAIEKRKEHNEEK